MSESAVAAILRLAFERRARGVAHDTIAHAALFDGDDLRVVERDGTEYIGSPIIAPGDWDSIGVRTWNGIEWFHAASLDRVEAVRT
jgi:hypothetical protein